MHSQLFRGTVCGFRASSPASISLTTHISNPPESPGTHLLHYAASPNDRIPLSQLAEASSGDSSLQSPARTEVCQVDLAPKTPKQSCQCRGCGLARRRACRWKAQAQGSVLGGKQRPCWKGAGLFMCFKHNSSTKPPPDKRLWQSELSTEIQSQG